ncbi:MAG: hypothetical protein IJW53_05195, partial [Clostridia bacterium]|nr:hypothetical protein [Clostridia bacterium]
MKTSNIRKIIATILVMVLTVTAIVATVVPGSAAESTKTYTLDATADLAEMAQGAKADGDAEKAGTDDFFTIHYSAKTKIDGSSKEFEDGYTASQRINMGGKTEIGDPIKNAIEFTTEGSSVVKIWWVCGGDGRELNLYGSDGTILETTAVGCTKNSLYISTFEIADAGKYYIGSSAGSNYYFKVEVSVSVPEIAAPVETTYALDATADLAEMAQGAKADGDAEKAGTDDFFTIHYSAKTKIDGSSKEFEDGYTASQRINMGGKTEIGDPIKNA